MTTVNPMFRGVCLDPDLFFFEKENRSKERDLINLLAALNPLLKISPNLKAFYSGEIFSRFSRMPGGGPLCSGAHTVGQVLRSFLFTLAKHDSDLRSLLPTLTILDSKKFPEEWIPLITEAVASVPLPQLTPKWQAYSTDSGSALKHTLKTFSELKAFSGLRPIEKLYLYRKNQPFKIWGFRAGRAVDFDSVKKKIYEEIPGFTFSLARKEDTQVRNTDGEDLWAVEVGWGGHPEIEKVTHNRPPNVRLLALWGAGNDAWAAKLIEEMDASARVILNKSAQSTEK
ncbi:MAG: hypothetical protein Q7R35_04685 [Elusimicrobiota bacterium]|nr:hypothetical protein [Elusimicrobiota bacterium]